MSTNSKKSQFFVASGLAGAAVTVGVTPSYAAGDIAEVNSTVASLAGISAAITTIVLGAMGVRMAIKLVNRVATKG